MLKSPKKIKLKRMVKAKQIFGHVDVQTSAGQWRNDRKYSLICIYFILG